MTTQERYKILSCLDRIDEIERWRDGLNEAPQRKYNHPSCIWNNFRKATRPRATIREPVRSDQPCRQTSDGHGRPIFWDGDAIRRAATAMRESRSNDWLILARLALEAAIRSADDLDTLDSVPMRTPSKRQRATAEAAAAALI